MISLDCLPENKGFFKKEAICTMNLPGETNLESPRPSSKYAGKRVFQTLLSASSPKKKSKVIPDSERASLFQHWTPTAEFKKNCCNEENETKNYALL